MKEGYDIPLAEAQVNWEPHRGNNLPPVEVVGAVIDDDLRYMNSWGACNVEFAKATLPEKIEMLLAQFVYITSIDQIPPKDAFKAFLQIPEFRDSLGKIGWRNDRT